MNPLSLKIGGAAVLLTVGLAGGLAPLRLGTASVARAIFALSNAFAGGVFLGAGLIHMLPDADTGLRAWLGSNSYPVAFLLAAVGFTVVLFFERVLPRQHDDVDHLAPYLLAVVLSIHSLLAGLALGAQDRAAGALVILVALLLHKGSAAFALGVSLVRHGIGPSKHRRAIGVFAVSTPFGIVAATACGASLSGAARQGFEGVFDAVAAGTFLYVATLDIVQEEFREPAQRGIKFALLLMGLGLMALIAVWI